MTQAQAQATRIEIAQAAVSYAAKRSNRVSAKEYKAAVSELLAARADADASKAQKQATFDAKVARNAAALKGRSLAAWTATA